MKVHTVKVSFKKQFKFYTKVWLIDEKFSMERSKILELEKEDL